MAKRARRTAMADHALGIRGTRMRRMLEGRWVKTMVLIRPNFLARRAATNPEKPAKRLEKKKMEPMVVGERPKRRLNQRATMESMTKPPPKASRAKRAESLKMMREEWWRPKMAGF